MFTVRLLLSSIAMSVAMSSILVPARLSAAPRGLIRSPDFSEICWVDRFGVSHNVSDAGAAILSTYFKNEAVQEIDWDAWILVPKGGPITAETPPTFYDASTTRITLQPAEIPRPHKSTSITSFQNVAGEWDGSGGVRTETVTTSRSAPSPGGLDVLGAASAASSANPRTTNILGAGDEPDSDGAHGQEPEASPTPISVRTDQTFTRRNFMEKSTAIETPHVTQTQVEQVPFSEFTERRVVMTRTDGVVRENRHFAGPDAAPPARVRESAFGSPPFVMKPGEYLTVADELEAMGD